MEIQNTIAAHDDARSNLKLPLVPSPSIAALPAWFRGRVFFRLTLDKHAMNEDHSEGQFVFAGYVFYWCFCEIDHERCIQLYMAEDM